jgi:AcrR family transcriptional regulator
MAARKNASTRQSKPRRTPEEASEHILDAAECLMAERGPDAVGIQHVAKAAGVSHPLVIHYFGSYDALVRAVLRRRNQRLGNEVMQRLASSEHPLDGEGLLNLLLSSLSDPVHARLLAWAALSGQAEQLALVKNAGLKRVADVLEAKMVAEAIQRQAAAPARARLNQAVLVGTAAVLGFATFRSLLLPGLGLRQGQHGEAAFQSALHELLQMYLAESKPETASG